MGSSDVSVVLAAPNAMNALLASLQRAGVNTVVIDAKDDGGVLYESALPLARELSRHVAPLHLQQVVATIHERGFYVIARIVTFKDPVLAGRRPEWALHTPSGKLWADRSRTTWVDPWKRQVWDYNLAIAEEVARAGTDVIQFDYVRFPEPFRDLPPQVSPAARGPRREAIRQFVAEAHVRVGRLHAQVAADVFGYAMHARNDIGIGQQWELMLGVANQISPMIYPSHYSAPGGGAPHPNACPYAATRHTLALGLARSQRARDAGANVARIVPWLQAFDAPWIDRSFRYGPRAVAAQIRAVHDAGLRDWILWNPKSTYESLLPGIRDAAATAGVDAAACEKAFRWVGSPGRRPLPRKAHPRQQQPDTPFGD